ncbi:DUF2911 domain-containing protein [Antarcticibacterium arcticum]|uniref:DUF2911 domain-containing protein n=1 Tax=Antarcticibacterium arcticum TaxID=2585771 RepID=A0A5B8YNG1_9FLAO|nr:DUF2911 domain-containing protein [Antarcticibacterium arcticum]QED38173.1 DUF2911 domain-containing protein [Antarcticibacterium arcticum]
MNKIIILLISVVMMGCGNDPKQKESAGSQELQETHEHHETAETSPPSKTLSPYTSAMAMIGDAHIHIDYSSPSVRERIIFGGLVGYNTVWQAGAHKATWIETDKNLIIDGKALPQGKYGIFVIPGKEQWEVMFNTRWDQHGKDDYNETENVLSLSVKPVELQEIQESLKYEVIKTNGNSGVITMAWEKVKIEIPFQVGK